MLLFRAVLRCPMSMFGGKTEFNTSGITVSDDEDLRGDENGRWPYGARHTLENGVVLSPYGMRTPGSFNLYSSWRITSGTTGWYTCAVSSESIPTVTRITKSPDLDHGDEMSDMFGLDVFIDSGSVTNITQTRKAVDAPPNPSPAARDRLLAILNEERDAVAATGQYDMKYHKYYDKGGVRTFIPPLVTEGLISGIIDHAYAVPTDLLVDWEQATPIRVGMETTYVENGAPFEFEPVIDRAEVCVKTDGIYKHVDTVVVAGPVTEARVYDALAAGVAAAVKRGSLVRDISASTCFFTKPCIIEVRGDTAGACDTISSFPPIKISNFSVSVPSNGTEYYPMAVYTHTIGEGMRVVDV